MFMRTLTITVLTLTMISAAYPAGTATHRVPLDYASIGAAMTAAGEGDTVLVAPGTYAGAENRDLIFGGINMVIISEAGPETTIIDCEGVDRAFVVMDGEDSTSVISGFTITNGSGGNGGCISVSGAAAIIENCIISNSTASMNGGGIHYGYAPTRGYIRNCVFFGNSCQYRGGGLALTHGYGEYVAPIISDCVFYDNAAGLGDAQGGGAIFSNSCPSQVTRCTMVGNSGGPGAGGIHSFDSAMIVTRSIVAHNTGAAGAYNVYLEHCLLYNNEGTDVIDPEEPEIIELDPLFCDLVGRVLTLCNDSSCLPGAINNPWGEQLGAYEAGCANCGMGTEESSWGSIKKQYRR